MPEFENFGELERLENAFRPGAAIRAQRGVMGLIRRNGVEEDEFVEIAACSRCGLEHAIQNLSNNQFGFERVCENCIVALFDAFGIDREVGNVGLRAELIFGADGVPRGAGEKTDKQGKEEIVEAGDIIKSSRTFGLEFEVNLGQQGQRALRDSIGREFQLVRDGSVNAGIEVVSPVMQGKKGETMVREMCKELGKVKAGADDSCGLHVHIGAHDFFKSSEINIRSLTSYLKMGKDRENYRAYILDPNILKDMRDYDRGLYEAVYERQTLDTFSINEFVNYEGKQARYPIVFAQTGNVEPNTLTYITPQGSRGARVKKSETIKDAADIGKYRGEPVSVSLNYNTFMVVDQEQAQSFFVVLIPRDHAKEARNKLNRIKRLAAAVIAFDDVFAAMLPCDRRDNDFAIRASTRLAIRDIHACDTILEFFNCWTKTKDLRGFRQSLGEQRHESRYYGINFRALLKHGTVEIRYHAGTTDSEKALHWTALFQKIVDIASDLNDRRFGIPAQMANGLGVDLRCLERADMIIDINRKTDLLFAKLQLPEATEKYLRMRVKEFADEDKNFVESLIAADSQ